MTMLVFLDGGTFISLRVARTALMYSIIVSKSALSAGQVGSCLRVGPRLRHDGLGAAGQGLVNFLGDERHERVQQAQRAVQHPDQHLAGGIGLGLVAGVQAGLADLDIQSQ